MNSREEENRGTDERNRRVGQKRMDQNGKRVEKKIRED